MPLLDAIRRKVNAAAGPFVWLLRDCYRPSGRPSAAHRKVRRAVRGDDGSSLIEFAATLGLMMTFIFVLTQISMALYTYGMISECAREATRWASVRGTQCLTAGGASCTATTTSVSNYAKGLGFPNIGGSAISPVTTYPDLDEAPGHRVKVTITYPYSVSLPFVPQKAISLQVSSEMYILQ